MQLNALVTLYLFSVVCTKINETILEDEEVQDDAHLTWEVLEDLYDEDCLVSSVVSTIS